MKTTIACGLFSAAFLGNIIWTYETGSSLFSWHPTLMVAGQVLLVQGVALYGKLNPSWRLTVHWVLQGLATVSFLLGFLAIYINKNNNSKPHFVSWHGIAGLTTVLMLIGQNFGGVLGKYRVSFGSLIDNKLLRKAHRANGIICALLTVVTISLVVKFPSWLSITYFAAVILPTGVVLYRIASKKFGLQSSSTKKEKSELKVKGKR